MSYRSLGYPLMATADLQARAASRSWVWSSMLLIWWAYRVLLVVVSSGPWIFDSSSLRLREAH
ncbi:hypothetical protein EMG21_28490 [Klebsiella pneumoniae]|nr:hypothetical protein EMG21_28490 [Klebsiella pneumoniae]